MNLFDKEEIERIEKDTKRNELMEDYLSKEREKWNQMVEPLFSCLIFNKDNYNALIESQANSLSCRQQINENISYYLNRRSKEEVKLKRLKQEKFVLYAISSPLKTNLSEKVILIEGHIAENQRSLEIIENYIDFLRSTSKNLESYAYAFKNVIELMNYIGR